MTQQGIPGLGYKQGRVGGDLDHERNLSQAGKYFTLGDKWSPCEHGVGTQEDDLSPPQVAYGQRKIGPLSRTKPGTFARKQQTPFIQVK